VEVLAIIKLKTQLISLGGLPKETQNFEILKKTLLHWIVIFLKKYILHFILKYPTKGLSQSINLNLW
jgi:hypothetical protein